MAVVVIKLLKDGSGRACIHWFRIAPDGPIETAGRQVMSMMGPISIDGKRGAIACHPKQNTVYPQQRGAETLVCCHSDDPRAVTCPDCQATAEFKAAVEEMSQTLSAAHAAG